MQERKGPIRYQCEKVEGKTKTFSLQNLKLSSLHLRRQKTPKTKQTTPRKKVFGANKRNCHYQHAKTFLVTEELTNAHFVYPLPKTCTKPHAKAPDNKSAFTKMLVQNAQFVLQKQNDAWKTNDEIFTTHASGYLPNLPLPRGCSRWSF